MNRITRNRVILFACLVALAAVVLFIWQGQREQKKAATAAAQQRKTEEDAAARKKIEAEQQHKVEMAAAALKEAEAKKQAALKAEQEAASEHAKFIAQYENTNFTRTPNIELIAVACAAEDGTMNQAMSTALAGRFKAENAELTTSFFKPTVITEGIFDSVFNGSGDIFKKLELPKYLDGLLLARQDVQYSTNADLQNVITASMHIHVVTLAVSGTIESQAWTLAANGSGFSPADARMQAEEGIIKQIRSDTTMSLRQSGGKH